MDEKLTLEFLRDRGYIPTCLVGGCNVVYNKWGFELVVHCNFISCTARMEKGLIYISTKNQLIECEKLLEIDKTPNMFNMSIDELKQLIPNGYIYEVDESIEKVESDSSISYNNETGRYKITKGDTVISMGYNDEDEDLFLCRALLYILKKENILKRNKQ
jgi:hypothetical protein